MTRLQVVGGCPCGIAKVGTLLDGTIDSGMVLRCDAGHEIVVDLDSPAARAERYARLHCASVFILNWTEARRGDVPMRVERCGRRDGPDVWAVRRLSYCLDRDGDWECEPLPSDRDGAFFARCRFASLDEAWTAAERALAALAAETKS